MVAPETPYPLAGGGALRTASLLHYLARGYDVDLIVFREPGAPDPEQHLPAGLVRRLFIIPLPTNRRNLAARAFRNAARVARNVPPLVDRFAGFDEPIARAINGARYRVGVIEHFWCAPYHPLIAAVSDETALNLHNVESVLHERCAAVEPAAAAFAHRVFAEAARELERDWLPRFSRVLATSESDAAQVHEIVPSARVVVYPNAVPLVPVPARGDDNAIVFSGNMEYHPNASAARFFRTEVWPRLRERWPGLVWRLVGKNPGAVAAYTSGDARIEVRGEVEDAVRELARARVAVVPVLAGSGTRLKILEAWSAGLPVVSTTIGAEGLGARSGTHLLLADGGELFAQEVSRLLACPNLRDEIGGAGRLLLEKEFTWEKAWKKLDF
jgi:glycosyltransferase involved in cell wall biosynthesis